MKNEFAQGLPSPTISKPARVEYADLSAEFPKCKQHPVFGPRIVQTPEQEAALGEGWYDSTADFPEIEVDNAPVEAPSCASCEALTKALAEQEDKFSAAYGE